MRWMTMTWRAISGRPCPRSPWPCLSMTRHLTQETRVQRELDDDDVAGDISGGPYPRSRFVGMCRVPWCWPSASSLRDGRRQSGPRARGLHSSTLQLNVSAFCGIGGALTGWLGGV